MGRGRRRTNVDWERCKDDLKRGYDEFYANVQEAVRRSCGGIDASVIIWPEPPSYWVGVQINFALDRTPEKIRMHESLCVELGKVADKHSLRSKGESLGPFETNAARGTYFEFRPDYKKYCRK